MSPEVAVHRAIARAERILPGTPAPDGKRDPRWQAMIRLADFIESHPEEVWRFCLRWGKHPQADTRMGVACVLLEHLVEQHFDLIFPRVRRESLKSVRFAATFQSCWCFDQWKEPEKYDRVNRLQRQLFKREFNRKWQRRRARERARAAGRRAT